jgi:hypothetical protein
LLEKLPESRVGLFETWNVFVPVVISFFLEALQEHLCLFRYAVAFGAQTTIEAAVAYKA